MLDRCLWSDVADRYVTSQVHSQPLKATPELEDQRGFWERLVAHPLHHDGLTLRDTTAQIWATMPST